VSQFKNLGTTVTNQNLIQKEIKRRLNTVLIAIIRSRTFWLLICCKKNFKIRIYKTIILPTDLYGCETWSLTLREEHRLRAIENRVGRRIIGLKRDEVKGEWRNVRNEELQ
jgi:hypothetical protein